VSEPDGLRISVVIVTRDPAEPLRRCLESLCRQDFDPAAFELILVEEGPDSRGVDFLGGLETPYRLQILHREDRDRAAARRAGVELSRAPACLFLCDRGTASPELVAAHAAAHADGRPKIGLGKVTLDETTSRGWYESAHVASWNQRAARLLDGEAGWADCDWGNASVTRRALVDIYERQANGRSDADTAFLLSRAGCVVECLPTAAIARTGDLGRNKLLKDAEARGATAARLARENSEATQALLGWFGGSSASEVLARRILLALRFPPAPLAAAGRLLPQRRRQTGFEFVDRYAFWRGARRNLRRSEWARITHGTPILAYHAFGTRSERERFVVPAGAFSMQMRMLSALGFRVIGVEELVEAQRRKEAPPHRAIAITIDDGYRDNRELAEPILSRHSYSATIFLVSGRLGGVNDWGGVDRAITGRQLLTENEVAEMSSPSIRFGSHTRTHPRLSEVVDAQLDSEVGGSREDIEGTLGTPVGTFAYPYGRRDERATAAVRRAGYSAAFTTGDRRFRLEDDLLQVPRIEVRGTDSLLRFASRLWLGAN